MNNLMNLKQLRFYFNKVLIKMKKNYLNKYLKSYQTKMTKNLLSCNSVIIKMKLKT